MKKIRNFHAGWICEASGEGSGAGEVGYQERRNAPRRNAWHGTADVSVVVVGTPPLKPDSEKRGSLLVDAPAAHLTVRKGPFGRRPLTPQTESHALFSRTIKPIPYPLAPYAKSFLVARASLLAATSAHAGELQNAVPCREDRGNPVAVVFREPCLKRGESTVAVTEGDTLKPTIDAGCAIRAGNGMTRERSAGRATTTLEQHAPPVREPQRVQWHPRRRLERRRPGPARACVPSRVRIRAPGASRLDQVRRAEERRVQPTVSRRAATITPPRATPTARPASMSRSC